MSPAGSDQTQATDSGDETAGAAAAAAAGASAAAPDAAGTSAATPTAAGGSAGAFSDSLSSSDSSRVSLTGDAGGQTAAVDETTTATFADRQPALGTTPADSDSGAATFTLHRDIVYDAGGNATLQGAVLDVTGSYTDALSGPATFTIHVTGNPTGGFTTTVSETGTDVFANLNVTVSAADGWLGDFAGSIEQAIAAHLGSSATVGDGNATNTQAAAGGGSTVVSHDAGGVTETQTVDPAGNVLADVRTADATGVVLSSVVSTYDTGGHKLSETDGTGAAARTTTWTYDTGGHQTSETVAAGTAQAATTLYAWQGDNLVAVTDPDGNVTRFGYDDQGHVVAMTDPLGHTETRTYDDQGRLASITDRDGQRRVLAYDDAGRLARETWYAADGVTVTDVQTYCYDAQGRLKTATNNAGTYTFTYDEQGRLIRVDEPFGVWLAFGYDGQGHRTLVADSFGGTTASTYDAAGDLTDRSFSQDGELVAALGQTFNDQGQLTGQTRTSPGDAEIDTTYDYDFAGRVDDIVSQAGGATLAEFVSAFDDAGDLVSETDDGQQQQFTYDGQGQLTGDAVGPVESFDGNGNRTTPGYVTGADNQLLSDGTWNYGYDADGNEASKTNIATGESWSYGYDARDHLVHAEERTADGTLEVSVDYKYDVFGNRVETDTWTAALGEVVTKYAQDGWDPARGAAVGNENWDVWADLNADGTLRTRYLRTDAVDAVFARIDAGGSPYWYLTDRLGSIRAVVDAGGQVKDALCYDGYGNIASETDATYRGRYAWTGREYDVETGLQYNRARYYDAPTGRWISQDPLGFDAGDSNLYRYATNRPDELVDPSGNAGEGEQDPAPGPSVMSRVWWYIAPVVEAVVGRDRPAEKVANQKITRLVERREVEAALGIQPEKGMLVGPGVITGQEQWRLAAGDVFPHHVDYRNIKVVRSANPPDLCYEDFGPDGTLWQVLNSVGGALVVTAKPPAGSGPQAKVWRSPPITLGPGGTYRYQGRTYRSLSAAYTAARQSRPAPQTRILPGGTQHTLAEARAQFGQGQIIGVVEVTPEGARVTAGTHASSTNHLTLSRTNLGPLQAGQQRFGFMMMGEDVVVGPSSTGFVPTVNDIPAIRAALQQQGFLTPGARIVIEESAGGPRTSYNLATGERIH